MRASGLVRALKSRVESFIARRTSCLKPRPSLEGNESALFTGASGKRIQYAIKPIIDKDIRRGRHNAGWPCPQAPLQPTIGFCHEASNMWGG